MVETARDAGIALRDARSFRGLDNHVSDGAPALLTGVEQRHARGAKAGPVAVLATVWLSNPTAFGFQAEEDESVEDTWRPGTVNLLVGTDRSLSDVGQ